MKSGKSSEKNKKPNEDNRGGDDLKSTRTTLPDFMFGVNVLFHEVEEDQRKKLTRYLIAYPFLLASGTLCFFGTVKLPFTSCFYQSVAE